MGTLIILAFISCICVILIVISLISYKNKQRQTKLNNLYTNIVHDTSKRYKSLLDVKQRYVLNNVTDITDDTISINTNTLNKFKTFNIDKYIENYVRNNKEYILKESIKVMQNRINQEKYNQAIQNIPSFMSEQFCITNNLEYSRYNKIEIAECSIVTIKFAVIKNIKFIIQYNSPAGRNHYEEVIVKDIIVLSELLKIIETQDNYRQSEEYKKKHERQLLTPGLRYDIMKRDGFKCVLCGRTAADGVKLHVDHIKPISKGGLTVSENLRTLCKDCNLGKSDKYDETVDIVTI